MCSEKIKELYKKSDNNYCYLCENCERYFTPRQCSAYESIAVYCPKCEKKVRMNFREYQEFVWELASEDSRQDFKNQLGTAGLGLAGEAGECADIAKKVLFQGKNFDRDEFVDELSDVLWYMAFAATMCEISLEEIMQVNIAKLKDRYKGGKFSVEEFQAKEDAKNE